MNQEYWNEFANGYKTGFFHKGGEKSVEPPLDRMQLHDESKNRFTLSVIYNSQSYKITQRHEEARAPMESKSGNLQECALHNAQFSLETLVFPYN